MKTKPVVLLLLCLLTAISVEGQLKKRIAVSRFEDRSGAGYARIGDGVADMLTTTLVKSGKFLVFERQEMDEILKEQKLSISSLATPETAAKLGKILGVELLVIGSVSEFGTKQRDISGGVSLFGAGLSTKTARAAVDIRLVNTSTAEIIAAEKEEGEESTTGVAVRYEDIDFSNTSAWNDTDIGKACRQAIDGCVSLITDNMEKIPWSGKIIKVNPDGNVLMKPGSEGNVGVGMEFNVFRAGEEIKDPDTGLSLGSEETKIGRIKVKEDMLKGKACKAIVVEGRGLQIGDIIREQ